MGDRKQRTAYIAMWVFALAFGVIEAAAVVYLRATTPHDPTVVRFPLVLTAENLVSVEIVREACTLIVLGAVAWIAARRWADLVGAFLLMFGVWDLTYYAVLRLVIGWPDGVSNWDLLFLIPLPWVAPVWAPATVAAIFVAAGSYLFWTATRARRYTPGDIAVILASAAAIVGACLMEWRVVFSREVPQHFPLWLYWAGIATGTLWFVHAERRRSRSMPKSRDGLVEERSASYSARPWS